MKHFYLSLAAVTLLFLAPACKRDNHDGPPVYSACLSVAVQDAGERVTTRTLLTGSDIETRITGLTVAVYQRDGTRLDLRYCTAGFDQLDYTFEDGESYNIFALANMGDMSSAFPSTVSGVEAITYSIPGYTLAQTGINARGIPMAGSLSYLATEGSNTVIPLTRLMAKLETQVSCDWPGVISSVSIHQLNGTLKPFGASAAASAGDILSDVEIDLPATAASEGAFVFYLPENLQGSIQGLASAPEKSRDNAGVLQPALKSYLEVEVQGKTSDGYSGPVTYRSYLGNNDSDNFDIERNCRYRWTLSYSLDGIYGSSNWKRENGMSWSRPVYALHPADACTLYLGESAQTAIYQIPADYRYGSFYAYTGTGSEFTGGRTWCHQDPDNASVQNDAAVIQGSVSEGRYSVTGTGGGTRLIFARIDDPSIPESDRIVGPRTVHVLDEGRPLPPLTLAWSADGTPGYVAQQGKVVADGLADGESVVGFTELGSGGKLRISRDGNTALVGLVGAGSTTLRVTTSLSRTQDLSISVTAPRLRFFHFDSQQGTLLEESAGFYGHPDGGPVTRASHGLETVSSEGFIVQYVNASGALMQRVAPPASGVVTGDTALAASLYDEKLTPSYSSNSALLAAVAPAPSGSGLTFTGGVYVHSLSGYPSAGGSLIGTVSVAPSGAGTGVSAISATIRSVYPFSGFTAVQTQPTEYDYSLVSTWFHASSTPRSVETGSFTANMTYTGIDFRDAGQQVLSGLGTLATTSQQNQSHLRVTYDLMAPASQAILAQAGHYAGPVSIDAYVQNRHSGEKWYCTAARFDLLVYGAIGYRLQLAGNSAEVSIGFVGDETTTPLSRLSHLRFARTDLTHGESLSYSAWSATAQVNLAGAGVGETLFTLVKSGGNWKKTDPVHEACQNHILFTNQVSDTTYGTLRTAQEPSLGGGVEDATVFYYQPPGGPVQSGSGRGYYKLYRLYDLEDLLLGGPNRGWLP